MNNDDDASMYGHSDSFMVELRIDVFQDVKAMKEHKVDIKVSTIIGTEAKIVKQVSSWRPAGITWVRLEPRTTRTTRNTSDEVSWDRAKARSLAGGTAIYLALNRLDIAYDIEELIEGIGDEAVAENLNDAGMKSANSEVSSEEPEFVWTVLCRGNSLVGLVHSDSHFVATEPVVVPKGTLTVRGDEVSTTTITVISFTVFMQRAVGKAHVVGPGDSETGLNLTPVVLVDEVWIFTFSVVVWKVGMFHRAFNTKAAPYFTFFTPHSEEPQFFAKQ